MVRKEEPSGQRYACDRPGCGKHYSRPDHLLRHKLNHDREKVLACDQCDRTFVRQDLLVRHLERHAVRGKTLGRWSARQSDGSASSPKSASGKRPRTKTNDSLPGDDETGPGQHNGAVRYSDGHIQTASSSDAQMSYSMPMNRFDSQSFHYSVPSSSQQYGYHADNGASSSALSAQQSIAPPVPYDATFDAPSTSSYGYLHPPAGNAGQFWEVRQDAAHDGAAATTASRERVEYPAAEQANAFAQPFGGAPEAGPSSLPDQYAALPAPPDSVALLHSSVPGSSHFAFSAPASSNDLIADYAWLFDGTDPFSLKLETEATREGSATHTENTSTITDTPVADREARGDADQAIGLPIVSPGADSNATDRAASQGAGAAEPADALRDLAFFAILQTDIPDEPAFDVDQTTTARLLHFLSSLPELATSPLFTPAALRCYLHLFFTRLNAIYPLIHQPTFSAKSADAMLLSAMIVSGAHFADEAAHFLAERIGRKLWGAFISFEDFRPARATLALLQAMLITETFGKMMGTRPQHETAHLFHNFIVTLARRNAVFVQSKSKLPHEPEARWRAWAREEEKKRISFYSFILDAQHAAIFRHTPALSSFQIHLQLPCDEREWEAKSAQEWSSARQERRGEPPNFISALKVALTHDKSSETDAFNCDGFKQVVLFHGLMSVAYDLQWKQHGLLSVPDTSDNIANWKERLIASYNLCKRRLEKTAESTAMDKALYSLVEWALIVLHSDSVDIQIYAGLPTVMGRFIDHHTFSIARKSCRDWAKTDDARTALWHAARFLRATILPKGQKESTAEDRSSVSGVDFLLHHQWVQYLSSLVIWAYDQALLPLKPQAVSRADSVMSAAKDETPDGTLQEGATLKAYIALSQRVSSEEAPPLVDRVTREASSYLEYVCAQAPSEGSLSDDFDPPHQYSTAVLVLVEKECRGSRWELGREASGVLRKLIRERNAAKASVTSSTGDK